MPAFAQTPVLPEATLVDALSAHSCRPPNGHYPPLRHPDSDSIVGFGIEAVRQSNTVSLPDARTSILGAMSSSNHRRRNRSQQRQRCGARVKNPVKIGKNGVRVSRGFFCKAWAMPNGRCRVHGGASTGPKSPEGKARVVAAMVEGRRKWLERRRAEGKKFLAGRKGGERWTTEPMRERARAEAHRLKGGRFTLDRALTLALLKSANGNRVWEAKAKAMLDAKERAAAERDREQALAIVNRLRAEATARRPDALQSVGPNAYVAGVKAPSDSDPATKFWGRNVPKALEVLGKILSPEVSQCRTTRDMRLIAEAASATIKAAISVDKNVLKAPRGEFLYPLKFPRNF
jgi:hypothetical protein